MAKTKRTPKGIDAGFAYNPGKAYMNPNTVPPLPAGYAAVLEARGLTWPTGVVTVTPRKPPPRKLTTADLLPSDADADTCARQFCNAFIH